MNSLFFVPTSFIRRIQTARDEAAEAQRRLNFELYGIHPFLRPFAVMSYRFYADRLTITISSRSGYWYYV